MISTIKLTGPNVVSLGERIKKEGLGCLDRIESMTLCAMLLGITSDRFGDSSVVDISNGILNSCGDQSHELGMVLTNRFKLGTVWRFTTDYGLRVVLSKLPFENGRNSIRISLEYDNLCKELDGSEYNATVVRPLIEYNSDQIIRFKVSDKENYVKGLKNTELFHEPAPSQEATNETIPDDSRDETEAPEPTPTDDGTGRPDGDGASGDGESSGEADRGNGEPNGGSESNAGLEPDGEKTIRIKYQFDGKNDCSDEQWQPIKDLIAQVIIEEFNSGKGTCVTAFERLTSDNNFVQWLDAHNLTITSIGVNVDNSVVVHFEDWEPPAPGSSNTEVKYCSNALVVTGEDDLVTDCDMTEEAVNKIAEHLHALKDEKLNKLTLKQASKDAINKNIELFKRALEEDTEFTNFCQAHRVKVADITYDVDDGYNIRFEKVVMVGSSTVWLDFMPEWQNSDLDVTPYADTGRSALYEDIRNVLKDMKGVPEDEDASNYTEQALNLLLASPVKEGTLLNRDYRISGVKYVGLESPSTSGYHVEIQILEPEKDQAKKRSDDVSFYNAAGQSLTEESINLEICNLIANEAKEFIGRATDATQDKAIGPFLSGILAAVDGLQKLLKQEKLRIVDVDYDPETGFVIKIDQDIKDLEEAMNSDKGNEQVKTDFVDISDPEYRNGTLMAMFGTTAPSANHVHTYLNDYHNTAKTKSFLETKIDGQGTYPTESDVFYDNVVWAFVKMKNGKFWRIAIARRDFGLEDESWIATHHIPGRWVTLAEVQDGPSYNGGYRRGRNW